MLTVAWHTRTLAGAAELAESSADGLQPMVRARRLAAAARAAAGGLPAARALVLVQCM